MTQLRNENGQFMSNTDPIEIHTRINLLDRQQASLEASHNALSSEVSKMAQGITQLSIEMRNGFDKMAQERSLDTKTPWGTITSIMSVGLVIIGAFFSLVTNYAGDARQVNTEDIKVLSIESQELDKKVNDIISSNASTSVKLDIYKDMTKEISDKLNETMIAINGYNRFTRDDGDKIYLRLVELEKTVSALKQNRGDLK